MKLHKWSDTLAMSKLSSERRSRIRTEVARELLEMNLEESSEAVGARQADVATKRERS